MQFNYQSFLALSVLIAAANADIGSFTSALDQIVKDAGATDDAVSGFSADKGLTAALTIQENATKLSKDLDAALSAASGVDSSSSSEAASAFAKLDSPVSKLLGSLIQKASDFAKVGTTSIVQNDLDELQGKSNKLLGAVYGIVQCGKDADSVASVGSDIFNNFVSADSAYSVNTIEIAQSSCQGGSGGGASSAAPSSAAESSAAGSSAAGSSEAAPTSAASSSAAAGSSAAGTSAAPSGAGSGAGSGSAPVAAGAGQVMVNTGVGLLAVGAAALLM